MRMTQCLLWNSVGLDFLTDIKIQHTCQIHPHTIQAYWQLLAMHDLLRFRLCDIEEPTWTDAERFVLQHGERTHYAVNKDGEICGEFTLDYVAGETYLAHFSMSPTAFSIRKRLILGQFLNWYVLTQWRGVSTLLGLIPTPNQAAIKFTLKAGYRWCQHIPNGQKLNGRIVDAELFILTQGDYHGRRR